MGPEPEGRVHREGVKVMGIDMAALEAGCDRFLPEADAWNRWDEAHVQSHGADTQLFTAAGSGIFVKKGCRFSMGAGCRVFVKKGARLFVLGNFSFWGRNHVQVMPGACLVFGTGYINAGVRIDCAKHVHIGNAIIGYDTYITDTDYHVLTDADGNVLNPPADVIFGGHVWVGQGATVLKGVTVGRGAVIGAKSLVCRDVPEACAVAGNPASVVRSGIRWK